jgi:hypothetical protein
VRGGAKLTASDKAELAQLADVPLRVALSVAYAANRCLRKKYTRACLPMFLQVNGQGHANLLVLTLAGRSLTVLLYEPNGTNAAAMYGTVATYFPAFEQTCRHYLSEPRHVQLRVAGQGLQTALGETSQLRQGMAIITRSRGYPVCEAVTLFFMRAFMTTAVDVDVEAFERELLAKPNETRERLLAFTERLATWVQTSYAAAVSARLQAIFDDSNVLSCHVRYGDVTAKVRP